MSIPTKEILDLDIACATYETAMQEVCALAQAPQPAAVSACNTHIVAAARQEPQFARIMQRFDLIVPDGTPIKWMLNAKGASLGDRVYGPYLMRHVIKHSSPDHTHYFFGGSSETLKLLEAAAKSINPDFKLAGSCSPPFRKWTEQDEQNFADNINAANPDFIWVALGGVRQEIWIIKNQHRFRRGVFFAIGDAFELLAGKRPFAPAWMQKFGLTWLYRLSQEPTRLWPRYLKYNSRFVAQLLKNSIFPQRLPKEKKAMRVAFLGSRGTPARYAGFETVVEQLGSRLAQANHEITVYNRSNHYPEKPQTHLGMRIVYLPTITSKKLETIVHSTFSALHALFCNYDVVYLCGVGNAFLARMLRWTGKKVVLNVDGIDYKRSKWHGFARWWLRASEVWGLHYADCLIADNHAVVKHYQRNYRFTPTHIAYGTNLDRQPESTPTPHLTGHGLASKNYLLFVSRLSPENEAHVLVEAYVKSGVQLPLVVVGPFGYEKEYFKKLQALANARVIFTGGLYGDAYRELSRNALMFILPSAIEATRLVLLDQMGMGATIVFREHEATREVIGNAGHAFSSKDPLTSLAEAISTLSADPALCAEIGDLAYQRARDEFNWDTITGRYCKIFQSLYPAPLPDPATRAEQALGLST